MFYFLIPCVDTKWYCSVKYGIDQSQPCMGLNLELSSGLIYRLDCSVVVQRMDAIELQILELSHLLLHLPFISDHHSCFRKSIDNIVLDHRPCRRITRTLKQAQ